MNQSQLQQSDVQPTFLAAACAADSAAPEEALKAGPGRDVHSRLLEQLERTTSGAACQRIAAALLENASPSVIDALVAQACHSQGSRHEHLVVALREQVDVVADGLARCLAHREAGVRLAGVRLVEAIGSSPATRLLAGLIEHETDAEVCSAAVVALGESGDHRVLPALRRLAHRFPGHNALAFDIAVAVGLIE